MDEDDGAKDGGTDLIGPQPSNNTLAFQIPAQSGIPAWMLARNSSVHAPVFGQPSARKSSCKPPSMPSTAFQPSTANSSLPETQAESPARNTTDEFKASPPCPKSSASVNADALNDDQALVLLLKNEAVASLLQNAFNARVVEHQQKLDQAYNHRLLELEEYTRRWRDTTKELWSAIKEGTFNPSKEQRDILQWQGPQDAGHGFNPELPTTPQEIVEKEFDSDRNVACIGINPFKPAQSIPKVACQEWITDTQCRDSFSPLGTEFRSIAGVQIDGRLMFRTTNKYGHAEYRPFKAIHHIAAELFNKHDVFIGLSPDNVRILGKALCYLKDRKDRRNPFSAPTIDLGNGLGNARRFYDYFLAKPAPTHIRVLVLPDNRKKRQIALRKQLAQQTQIPQRLLIARPCFNKNGKIDAATFLDVGNDRITFRRVNEEAIVLFEDEIALNRLTQLLEFSLSSNIVSDFKLSMSSSLGRGIDPEHASHAPDATQTRCDNELHAVGQP